MIIINFPDSQVRTRKKSFSIKNIFFNRSPWPLKIAKKKSFQSETFFWIKKIFSYQSSGSPRILRKKYFTGEQDPEASKVKFPLKTFNSILIHVPKPWKNIFFGITYHYHFPSSAGTSPEKSFPIKNIFSNQVPDRLGIANKKSLNQKGFFNQKSLYLQSKSSIDSRQSMKR